MEKETKRRQRLAERIVPKIDSSNRRNEVPATVAVIGAGPAGMEAAALLAREGCRVKLFEAKADLAGNLLNKYKLFPNLAESGQLAYPLIARLEHERIALYPETEIKHIVCRDALDWVLIDTQDREYRASAVLLTTGYEVFDARRKEELGYGIYPGVITSADLETMFKEHRVKTPMGEDPRRIVFLQCVGSRDEKSGNRYCSKVCCVTAVKQAIEAKTLYPEAEVYVYYMDLRMWGQGFEELYRVAQEQYNIRFVRGRISEAAGTFDGRVQIKAEDTLIGQPVKMNTDLLVLMVGMEASCGTKALSACCGIQGEYGFARSLNPHIGDNLTERNGLFLAGACKRPMCLTDVIQDARSAVLSIVQYLS